MGSLALLASLGWMVYDDYARGWKGYQAAFARLDAEKTRAALKAQQEKLDATGMERLTKELADAQAQTAGHPNESAHAEARLKAINLQNYPDDLSSRTAK